jgi:two-component system chemotaxis sensor kinase CheA
MDDPYKYFRIEARELADELEKGVLNLERGAPAAEVVASLLRFAHTLKGAARVVKQPDIADQAHALEDALGPFRESTEPVPRDRLGVVRRLLDGIRGRVAALASPGEKDSDEGAAPAQRAAPEDALRTVRADVAEMDALLGGVGAAHAHLGSLRGGVGLIDKARNLVDVLVHEVASLRRRDFTPSEPAASRETARSIEKAHSIAGELRGVVGALEQKLGNSVEQVDRELRQARDAAQRLRLVPAASMFTDLERAARDVAQMQGKRVRFDGRGGNLRLDAHVVAVAQSALHQIVRNAVAHGIESENERQAAGKTPDGRVTLEVARRDRRVVFSCRDDGRGVDLDAVRGVAHRKGLASAATSNLGPEELIDLLLRGGISTSRTVTEVSGRGIGLDVVRDAAARLGGQITVTTKTGHGTTVELVAPLSLAALEVLTVEAGDGAMTIPLDAVRQTLRVPSDEIASSSQGESLVHEGRSIPFLPLAAALWDTAAPTRFRRSWSTVIVEGQGDVAAIGVHRLLGTANIAVRPLPDPVPASAAVSGVWTDADGNPRLVLDPDSLVAEARRHRQPASDEEAPDPPILVIDDSLTTRMLEQSILESAGYDVEVASSAEEALAMAATKRYSLCLVDVEMPGMDGFTFIERTRASSGLRDLPCILVTSRTSPEDRRRGFDAGAQAYIAKGRFDQRELLSRVRELMAG